jgi:hypothetical protein
MNFRKFLSVLIVAGFTLAPVAAWADTDADLRAEIEALKSRLADLESKLASQPAASVTTPAGTPVIAVPSMLEGIGVSGFVNSTYQYNFNNQDNRTNVGRVFDRHSNSFNLSQAELAFQKPVSEDSRAGFRTDLFFGNDAEVITSTGLGSAADEFDLEQAYVEILAPTTDVIPGMNDWNLKFGKFVTLAGAEVIESKDNWNTSRGLLFGYAIPFTHTGVRATHVFDNGWDLILGVNNGWDQTDDANNEKTIEAHFGFNSLTLPGESTLTVALNYYDGEENTTVLGLTDSESRRLIDVVAIWNTPIKPLTLMYNYDYAHQDGVFAGIDETDANWYGHAVYGKWTFNPQWAIAGRFEFFDDTDGQRVVAGTPAEYTSLTGTLEYRPWANVITRLEYRYDDANRNVYNEDAILTDSQSTLGGEVALVF